MPEKVTKEEKIVELAINKAKEVIKEMRNEQQYPINKDGELEILLPVMKCLLLTSVNDIFCDHHPIDCLTFQRWMHGRPGMHIAACGINIQSCVIPICNIHALLPLGRVLFISQYSFKKSLIALSLML